MNCQLVLHVSSKPFDETTIQMSWVKNIQICSEQLFYYCFFMIWHFLSTLGKRKYIVHLHKRNRQEYEKKTIMAFLYCRAVIRYRSGYRKG